MKKKFFQEYTVVIETDEELIDISNEVDAAVQTIPSCKGADINVNFESEGKTDEENWTEDPEEEFKCEKCGTEWKQKDGVSCPKCDPEDEE